MYEILKNKSVTDIWGSEGCEWTSFLGRDTPQFRIQYHELSTAGTKPQTLTQSVHVYTEMSPDTTD